MESKDSVVIIVAAYCIVIVIRLEFANYRGLTKQHRVVNVAFDHVW